MSEYGWRKKAWIENKFTDVEDLGDKWGHRFRASQRFRMDLALELVTPILTTGRAQSLLDIGCGLCEFTERMAALGPDYRVHGCDISENAIAAARRRLPHFELKVNALPELAYNNDAFDLITALEVLYYLDRESRERALAEIYRCLKKGGLFLLSGVLGEGTKYFDENEIRNMLTGFFSIREVRYNYARLYDFFEHLPLGLIFLDRAYRSQNPDEIDFLTDKTWVREMLKHPWVGRLARLPLSLARRPLLALLASEGLVRIGDRLCRATMGDGGKAQILILCRKV